ncbi:hypothetical protein FB451DRAFT_593976 [Mycena latifolia]|nr:hypothetical protein FB451DRAFT_593976 [Mycena latifolia]
MTQHDLTPADNSESREDAEESQSVISLASTVVEESETLHRVEELWFQEDNLIIRAEDSLFRVSKGVLARRSPVFKEMLFGLPQPNANQVVTMYGCPVLQLPHAATSVEYFLKAIFDSEFFLPPPERSLFCVVVGVLRLAHDYGVKYLLRRALLHLETFYSSILDGERVYDPPEEFPEDADDEYPDDEDPDDESEPAVNGCPLVALQTASDVGALWNLPTIIYDCCTLDLGDLLDLPEWEGLSTAHQRQLLVAHAKQKNGARVVSQFLLAGHPKECSTNAECNVAKLRWIKILDQWITQGRDSDPLALWDEVDFQNMERDFCAVCLKKYEESHVELRKAFWDSLPETFDLPNWEELKRMKAEMFEPK